MGERGNHLCLAHTGLELELLQEFYFIPLDIFLSIMDNEGKGRALSRLEAWLYFIGSDKTEHIYRVIKDHPWFAELYEDVNEFRHHPEEAIAMFSDALRILDENTTRYMIDELKQEIDEQKERIDEQHVQLEKKQSMIDEQQNMIDEQQKVIAKLKRKLGEQGALLS